MQLKQYYIKPDLCAGCQACLAVCPAGAIQVTESGIPQIRTVLCNRCGACKRKCKHKAIAYRVRLQF
ncbi:4Fe-4S dicluster domain-containing protein [Propionispora vibrioides]|uniref:4Fe-4S dicluster domain-containing protein n=1 Tax=Propionispora vibrioides TaxID=112903 RepID=UPI000B8227D7|nr:4Fe-4S dicluster domain-containing protein [Propionispora vibrioides]